MKSIGIMLMVFLKLFYAESRMLPINYSSLPRDENLDKDETLNDTITGMKVFDEKDNNDEPIFEFENKRLNERTKKPPCAIVVLSNVQNPTMQSLLRKYRYDANGILIPSSVKYFIKLPRGLSSAPLLVPLNDKAFSPLGGFVRYYKEVPPIPQSW